MKPKYLAVILVKYPKADVAEIFYFSTDFQICKIFFEYCLEMKKKLKGDEQYFFETYVFKEKEDNESD